MIIKQFVIVQERSNGNESVGDMLVDTHVFAPTATLEEVWKAVNADTLAAGRTMLRPDSQSIVIPEPF